MLIELTPRAYPRGLLGCWGSGRIFARSNRPEPTHASAFEVDIRPVHSIGLNGIVPCPEPPSALCFLLWNAQRITRSIPVLDDYVALILIAEFTQPREKVVTRVEADIAASRDFTPVG